MKKIIFVFFILFASVFFLGPQPNTRSDINYSVVDNHISNLSTKDKDEINKYIIRAFNNYSLNYEIDISENIYVSTDNTITDNEILIVTTYDLPSKTHSNYTVLASTISAFQLSSKYGYNSGISAIILSNEDDLNNLKTYYEEYENLKYLYILDKDGFDGEYTIKSTSIQNNQIIDLYNKSTTSTNGNTALSKQKDSNIQLLELGILNSTSNKINIQNNSRRDIVNTIHEIIYYDYDSYEKHNSYQVQFFMFLDYFVVVPLHLVYIIAFITLLLSLISILLNFKRISANEIFASVLVLAFTLSIAVATSLLPYEEIFREFPYLIYKIGHLTHEITISNPFGLLITTLASLVTVVGVYKYLLKRNKFTLINVLVAINIILSLIATVMIFVLLQYLLVIIPLLLANSLIIIIKFNLKLKRAIVPGIMVALLIPILISNIYLLYTGVENYNLTIYSALFTSYCIVITQLLRMYFKFKS